MEHRLVDLARDFVRNLLRTELDPIFTYHRPEHTEEVVGAVTQLAQDAGLDENDTTRLLIAAWFHDTGYVKASQEHETHSIEYARTFMQEHGVSEADQHTVEGIIRATEMHRTPDTLLQSLMKDGDLHHLASPDYPSYAALLRTEWTNLGHDAVSDVDWVKQNIGFLTDFGYHSEVGNLKYGPGKTVNLNKLQSEFDAASDDTSDLEDEQRFLLQSDGGKAKKGKKKRKKKESRFSNNPDRGVETMFRVTLKNHLALSQVADNKANIMLSINAIIISVVLSALLPRLDENTNLIVPMLVLVSVCVISIVFATISTIPKVTQQRTTREDVEKRSVNLLFFGNFHRMNLDDYLWGMEEMVNDPDFLYSSMIKDLYFLGKVLHKKYTYLRYTYLVFMIGMVISVLAFVLALA